MREGQEGTKQARSREVHYEVGVVQSASARYDREQADPAASGNQVQTVAFRVSDAVKAKEGGVTKSGTVERCENARLRGQRRREAIRADRFGPVGKPVGVVTTAFGFRVP